MAQQQAVKAFQEHTQGILAFNCTDIANTKENVNLGIHWNDKNQCSHHVIPVVITGRPVEGFLNSGAYITLVEPHILKAADILPGKTAHI